ncbi:aminotransferase class V-fold PLP-dependent enzyme [Rhodopirellula sp. MGV]|uniref:aminotransferase class V-fold PLP-dependent enzyme n=1 Tax=Rhodopirellula sp. MGV TaxID=2023130 RepID=UPI000B97BBEF|nr:aminotransferase class V-fold PLP-dependent enzyme [Rhodopirellula sp. MGV]OYP32251.1 cysteine desulfurase [Rhodopirellula sp. MGV]PNY35967.1 aminotransferase class V-fold PLP-dependent enzyme [Rhodopirellula baltica]
MPITKNWTYLDHAAVGPLSAPAAQAICRYAGEAESQGDTMWPTWAGRVDELRRASAALLGTETDEICLIPNTSTGINLIAEGFRWQAGDSVVLPEGEFPSNLFPWENQAARGVTIRKVARQGDVVSVDDLLAACDASTKLISLSWVGYASGYRIDLERLVGEAHDRGILVFLDAIQGLGVFDLDLRKIDVDFLAADGHKWLLGPEGMGIAMIRRKHFDRLRCGNVGWNSVKNAFNYAKPELELKNAAERFEPGSANMVGSAALAASLDLFLTIRDHHGPDAIASRVLSLTDELRESLLERGITTRQDAEQNHRSGIVTFEVPGRSPVDVRNELLKAGCVVSCRDGGVRASVHAYNNSEDLSRLVNAIKA